MICITFCGITNGVSSHFSKVINVSVRKVLATIDRIPKEQQLKLSRDFISSGNKNSGGCGANGSAAHSSHQRPRLLLSSHPVILVILSFIFMLVVEWLCAWDSISVLLKARGGGGAAPIVSSCGENKSFSRIFQKVFSYIRLARMVSHASQGHQHYKGGREGGIYWHLTKSEFWLQTRGGGWISIFKLWLVK